MYYCVVHDVCDGDNGETNVLGFNTKEEREAFMDVVNTSECYDAEELTLMQPDTIFTWMKGE